MQVVQCGALVTTSSNVFLLRYPADSVFGMSPGLGGLDLGLGQAIESDDFGGLGRLSGFVFGRAWAFCWAMRATEYWAIGHR